MIGPAFAYCNSRGKGGFMPRKETIRKAKTDKKQGKSPFTQASEFVHEVIHSVHQGRHGVRNAKQAIAIGLSEARKAGVKIPSRAGTKKVKVKVKSAPKKAISKKVSASSKKRAKASLSALKREPRSTVSSKALSTQARSAARKKSTAARRAAALKGARTKGKQKLHLAAKKAAHTRAIHAH